MLKMEDDAVMHHIENMIVKKEKKRRERSKLVIINEDELIRQVEIRPILYDKSLKGYRKSALRDQSWKEIATLLGSTVEECRKRWRSLRDAFSKHYKQADGPLNAKKKKWIFYDQMYFIAPYLDCTNGKVEVSSIQENSQETVMDLEEEVDDNSFKEESSQNNRVQEEILDMNDENQFMTRIFTTTIEGKKDSQERTDEYATIVTTDSDERFLLSCSPILKRLSNKKNALARLKIQQILYSIEFGDQ